MSSEVGFGCAILLVFGGFGRKPVGLVRRGVQLLIEEGYDFSVCHCLVLYSVNRNGNRLVYLCE